MHTRISKYILAFFIATTAFLFLRYILGLAAIADSLYFALFAIASIMFVFSNEEVATENLDIPKVHYYQSVRTNIYGYFMAASLAATGILFYIATFTLSLNVALSSFILWTCMIGAGFVAIKLEDKYEFRLIIYDYLVNNLKNAEDIDKKVLMTAVTQIISTESLEGEKNSQDLSSYLKALKEVDLEESTKKRLVKMYLAYLKEISESELTSDEVREINK